MQELADKKEIKNIAMLIDGDNAQAKIIEDILTEAGKYGNVTVRRIYGDWTTANMNSWKDILHRYAVQPIQQFRYTKGKNATDSAMIIDAMDILYAGNVEGFCIVSSDSDYTKLATRVRESGLFVMGIGRKDTPESFVKACVKFTYTENLQPIEAEAEEKQSDNKKLTPQKKHKKIDNTVKSLLIRASEMSEEKEGEWFDLATLANNLYKIETSFDTREYGYQQLIKFIKATNLFETENTKRGPGPIYIKLK